MLLALGAASTALDALQSLTSSKSSSSQSTGVTQDAANPFDLSGTNLSIGRPPAAAGRSTECEHRERFLNPQERLLNARKDSFTSNAGMKFQRVVCKL